jgi:hypothetical protein
MQIRTTSSLSNCASRRSTANLSIAQKQMAPMTTIIKTPIKAESILIPHCRDSVLHHNKSTARAGLHAKSPRAGNDLILYGGQVHPSANAFVEIDESRPVRVWQIAHQLRPAAAGHRGYSL